MVEGEAEETEDLPLRRRTSSRAVSCSSRHAAAAAAAADDAEGRIGRIHGLRDEREVRGAGGMLEPSVDVRVKI